MKLCTTKKRHFLQKVEKPNPNFIENCIKSNLPIKLFKLKLYAYNYTQKLKKIVAANCEKSLFKLEIFANHLILLNMNYSMKISSFKKERTLYVTTFTFTEMYIKQ